MIVYDMINELLLRFLFLLEGCFISVSSHDAKNSNRQIFFRESVFCLNFGNFGQPNFGGQIFTKKSSGNLRKSFFPHTKNNNMSFGTYPLRCYDEIPQQSFNAQHNIHLV